MKENKIKGKCKPNKPLSIKCEIFNIIKKDSQFEDGEKVFEEQIVFNDAKAEKKFIKFVGECIKRA